MNKYHFLCVLMFLFMQAYAQKKLIDVSKEDDIKAYTYPVPANEQKDVVRLKVNNLSSGRPLDLRMYRNLQILRLDECDLGTIEIDFNLYPQLQFLYINNTSFDTLIFKGSGAVFTEISLYGRHLCNYDFLPQLENLIDVGLYDSLDIDMENLTSNLLKLKNLREIYISDGNIRKIPANFSNFKSLEWLSFVQQDNTFDYAQLFNTIKDIEINKLDLMFSGYTTLPPEIGLLKKIKHLYLRSSAIQVLPDEIGELTQLESLLASETALDTVPNALLKLKNLKVLELMPCNFKTIPRILYEMTWLEQLEIGAMDWFPTAEELKPLRKKLKHTKVNSFFE